MGQNRRTFLSKVGATGFTLTGFGLLSQKVGAVSIDATVAQAVENPIDQETKSNHRRQNETDYFWYDHFQGCSLRAYDVFETDLYGWQAHLGLNGCSNTARVNGRTNGLNVDKRECLTFTDIKAINLNEDYYAPALDDTYRGFYPKSGQRPDIPDWLEPTAQAAVSIASAAATSSLTASAATAIILSADDIIEGLAKDSGEEQIDNGRKVKWRPQRIGGLTDPQKDMSHYQRITGRFGDFTNIGPDLKIISSFNASTKSPIAGPLELDLETEFEFRVRQREDEGDVRNSKKDVKSVRPENWTRARKQETGYIRVEDGQPQNLAQRDMSVYSIRQITKYTKRLNKQLKNEELTAVMLNPPVEIT